MRDLLEGAELVPLRAKALRSPASTPSQALLRRRDAGRDSAGMCNAFKAHRRPSRDEDGHAGGRDDRRRAGRGRLLGGHAGGYAERFRNSWAYEEHMESAQLPRSAEVSPLFALGSTSR